MPKGPEMFTFSLLEWWIYFDLNRIINRHNCVSWATENPHITFQWKMKSLGSLRKRIIELYFFNGTVTECKYLQMLQTFFHQRCADVTFIQDGTPVHYSKITRDWFDNYHSGKSIGRHCPIYWSLDFYFWGI